MQSKNEFDRPKRLSAFLLATFAI